MSHYLDGPVDEARLTGCACCTAKLPPSEWRDKWLCTACRASLLDTLGVSRAPTAAMPRKWYESPGDLAMFLSALVAGEGLDADQVIHIVEKPWKWDAEFEAWTEAGRPDEFEVES